MNLNVRGVKNSDAYTRFSNFIYQLRVKPDAAIFLTEHWLDKNEAKAFYLKGYKLVAHFARKKRQRGGSLILIRDTLKCTFKKMNLQPTEYLFEACGGKLNMNGKILNLVALYRPSNSETNTKMDQFFSKFAGFICGRFVCLFFPRVLFKGFFRGVFLRVFSADFSGGLYRRFFPGSFFRRFFRGVFRVFFPGFY
jgi:hypothetical protein